MGALLVHAFYSIKNKMEIRREMSAYLTADRAGDLAAEYALLCSQDRERRSFDVYRQDNSDRAAVRRAIQRRLTFTIRSVDLHGQRATVTVSETQPDPTAILSDVNVAIAHHDIATLTTLLLNPSVPLFTQDVIYFEKHDKDGWHILRGW